MDPREKREDESWAEYGARMTSMGVAPQASIAPVSHVTGYQDDLYPGMADDLNIWYDNAQNALDKYTMNIPGVSPSQKYGQWSGVMNEPYMTTPIPDIPNVMPPGVISDSPLVPQPKSEELAIDFPVQKIGGSYGTGSKTMQELLDDASRAKGLPTRAQTLMDMYGDPSTEITDDPYAGPVTDPSYELDARIPSPQTIDMSRWDMLPDPTFFGEDVIPSSPFDQPFTPGIVPVSGFGQQKRAYGPVTETVVPSYPSMDATYPVTDPGVVLESKLGIVAGDPMWEGQPKVDTFVDMPQETQATRWDMTKATAEATARNVAGKLGIDLGPMDTNMSEEGLEKVLEAAWENKQSYPNNEVALTTLQAGALGLNAQDESAYDTMIGALPASAITLSPAGLSFYDPKGFQIGSKAAGTDENITHTKEIAKKWGFSIPEEVIDTIGVATGVQPVAGLAPYQGGGIDKPHDALYYAGYDTPAVAEPAPVAAPAPQPSGPSPAEIARQNAINAQMEVERNARFAQEAAARQQQQFDAVERSMNIEREKGHATASEVQAAINAMQGLEFGGVTSFPGYGAEPMSAAEINVAGGMEFGGAGGMRGSDRGGGGRGGWGPDR